MTDGDLSGTPRTRAHARTLADITRIGRQHLAAEGAAALSVRAVARDLGVVSSAIYRYVRNRDDLLTLLVVDGYDELGAAVDRVVAATPEGDFRGRFLAIGSAVRTWARAQPSTYALLFGSPVPGYQAPAERTTGPGTRVIRTLAQLWADAHAAGSLETRKVIARDDGSDDALAADLARVRADLELDVPDDVLVRGVLAWAGLFGCVSFEVFGQYGADTFVAADRLFDRQLELLADTVGLTG